MIKDYGEYVLAEAQENKANQSQLGYFTAEKAECAEVRGVDIG